MNIRFILLTFIFVEEIYCRVGVIEKGGKYYSNCWIVQIEDNLDEAKRIAQNEGFEIEEAPAFPGLYRFHHLRHPRKGKYENENVTQKLQRNPKVSFVRQMVTENRELRSFACPRAKSSTAESNYKNAVNDGFFNKQWYLQDCRKSNKDGPRYDINLIPTWYQHNLLGRGIIVIVIDDGFETTHIDLKDNYKEEYGYDLVDNDKNPDPVHYGSRLFSHGTRCGGVVAMRADNEVCGTGIAPLAILGAVRLLGPNGSRDDKDGMALSFKVDEVHVMTNSWGPTDDGKTMSYPGEYTRVALKYGIKKGRKGKGVIYIFAGGNGKNDGDMCGCDPFVSSIYTIAIASSDQNGKITRYSERCASIMATTYSGDKSTIYNVVTTDVFDKCTTQHSGTSAAAPIAAGAIALLLEARPELTWRDVQHVLAWTCEVAPLQDNKGWNRNGGGFYVSHDFGFGMLNILNMVDFAKSMDLVPKNRICVVPFDLSKDTKINASKPFILEVVTYACESTTSEINYIEHVQFVVRLNYSRRGDLQIDLKSPSGTTSHLLELRVNDSFPGGLNGWTFDTVHSWGEFPRGTWTVKIFDPTGKLSNKGNIESLTLVIHGTKEAPAHYGSLRSYYDFKLPD